MKNGTRGFSFVYSILSTTLFLPFVHTYCSSYCSTFHFVVLHEHITAHSNADPSNKYSPTFLCIHSYSGKIERETAREKHTHTQILHTRQLTLDSPGIWQYGNTAVRMSHVVMQNRERTVEYYKYGGRMR